MNLFRTPFVACLVCAAPAMAQVAFQAVVTEATPMRSGDLSRYYEVTQLEPGQIVVVEQDLGQWSAIRYPSGVGAFITGEDGRLVDGMIEVRAPTTLRAPSSVTGPSGSWKPLLGEPLEPGARLELIQAVEGRDGREFFLVEAPTSALGYVLSSSIRRATDSEIAAAGAQTNRPATNNQPAAEPETAQAETQAPREIDNSVPETTANAEQPAATPATTSQPAAPAPTPDRWASLRDLDRSFEELVAAENVSDADITELIGAFEVAIDSMGETPGEQAAKRGLERRVEILQIRLDVRQALESESEATAEAVAAADAAAQRALEDGASEGYLVIARIERSRLYNGSKLPLLFRLVDISPETSGATIAYIQPGEIVSVDALRGMVGSVVGIAGSFIAPAQVGGPRLVAVEHIDQLDGSLLED